jgi:hypothetical protein
VKNVENESKEEHITQGRQNLESPFVLSFITVNEKTSLVQSATKKPVLSLAKIYLYKITPFDSW